MKIAICDIDNNFINICKEYIQEFALIEGEKIQVKSFTKCEALLFELEEEINAVDLIIMDINFMEGEDGISAANKIREMGYEKEILFFTLDKTRVFDAFDSEPIHYLIKSEVGKEKVKEVFSKAYKRAKARNSQVISLSCAGESINLSLDDIFCFEVVQRIINVEYKGGNFEFYSTIGKLENLLINKGFFRVHRAFLVSLKEIKRVRGNDEIVLSNGRSIPIGRTYIKKLKEELSKLNKL